MKVHVTEVSFTQEKEPSGHISGKLEFKVHPILEIDGTRAKVSHIGINSMSTFNSIVIEHEELCDALEQTAQSIRKQLDNKNVDDLIAELGEKHESKGSSPKAN
jgi:hypothetical protein